MKLSHTPSHQISLKELTNQILLWVEQYSKKPHYSLEVSQIGRDISKVLLSKKTDTKKSKPLRASSSGYPYA